MRRLLRIVAVLVLLALVAGGIAVWSLLSDRERMTRLIVDTLREKLAVELTLGEPAEIALWPQPGVRLANITVGAASAATADRPIATARQLIAAVPWSTLFGGDLTIAALTLEAPEIDATRLAEWVAAYSGADGGPPAPPRWPSIATTVRVTNGRWIRSTGAIEDIDAEISPLVVGLPLDAQLGFTIGESRYGVTARFVPDEAPGTLVVADLDATVFVAAVATDPRQRNAPTTTLLRGSASIAGTRHWNVDLAVTGDLPEQALPATLGFDSRAATDGRISFERTATGDSIVVHGSFGGRVVDAALSLAPLDPSTTIPGLLDAIARTARGTAQIDRLDISGVQLEGIRIEAEPQAPADAH